MSASTLALRQDGAVLHLTLNRPEARNALSMAMVSDLRSALAQAEDEGQTRVIVLRGADGHFCAGADLRDMALARSRLIENPQALEQVNAAFGELCVAFADTGLATVAVLEGTVMGGGLGLACAADVVLASETVNLRLPETGLGLVPAQIAAILVQRLGHAEAKRLALTGASLDAAQALALRLAHSVHSTQALDAALEQVLAELLRCAPLAVAATKALMALACHQSPASLVQHAAEVFSAAALGHEGLEGTSAFVQKRKPSWVPR